MKTLSVKNLEKYQHYKERRPPWIKVHQELLEDYAFTRLHDASKAHLIAIWLLASRYDNLIPYDGEWIARTLHATEPVDIEVLVSAGFLTVSGEDDDASVALAPRKQSAKPEIEREIEKERASKPLSASWTARLAVVWSEQVGHVTVGHIGAALKEAVHAHGPERVERAMRAYIALQKAEGRPLKPKWFAEQVQVWIERTATPVAVIDGEMSPTLDLLTRTKAS